MDYIQALEDLKKYFADLIILQYRYAPENRALIGKLTDLIFANNLALQIRDLTVDVDNSFGAQLDIVGKWVGIDRFYGGELWDRAYLSFPLYSTIKTSSYSDYQGGFSKYSTFAKNNGGFMTYKVWQETRTRMNQMGDNYFRPLIKLKIIKNSINHTCKNIDNAIWDWSEGKVYTTWDVMKVKYNYDRSYKNLMTLAAYKKALPHPTGCTVELIEVN